MDWHFTLFGNILFFTSVVAAVVAVKTWQRTFPGKLFFFCTVVSAMIWSLANGMKWSVVLAGEKIFWTQISFFGIVNIAPAWFAFSLAYCGFSQSLTRRNIILLWIAPALMLISALTNSIHGLTWPSYYLIEHPMGNYLHYEFGPAFWILTAYSYILIVLTSMLLLRQSRKMFHIYQTQSLILFFCMVFPWIGNVLYLTRIITMFDLTPVAFVVSGSLLLWTMKRYNLFDIAPIAREALFANIREIAIVLDSQNRIVDLNPFALSHFDLTSAPVGKPISEVFKDWKELKAFVRADNIAELEISHTRDENTEWFLVSRSPLFVTDPDSAGTLLLCRDITQRKITEQEREHLIEELQEALANVKTLGGMLPICANCKKIRDDKGYWDQVERYISKHTDAKFTHGICPDCGKKMLEEYYRIKEARGELSDTAIG